MKNQWKLIVSILILIVVVIFALQNTNPVQVDIFYVKFAIPLVLVILLSLLIGVIVGLIGSFSAISKYRRELTSTQRELTQIKESHLRDLSDKDGEISRLQEKVKGLELKQNNTANIEIEPPTLAEERDV